MSEIWSLWNVVTAIMTSLEPGTKCAQGDARSWSQVSVTGSGSRQRVDMRGHRRERMPLTSAPARNAMQTRLAAAEASATGSVASLPSGLSTCSDAIAQRQLRVQ